MERTAALVLAGGRVTEMGTLTLRRAKAALPFAGTLRIIDFPMSNLAQSGVDRVGVLSQYRPSSLMDHIGTGESWGLVGRGREVRILPPFQAESNVSWYRGTADAVFQNLNFLGDAERVLIVSGDHVYHMDYRRLVAAYEAAGAHLTMVFKRFPRETCRRFGVGCVDGSMRVTSYEEKPAEPRSDLASLTVYLFEREVLEHYLRRAYAEKRELYQLYDHVIPPLVQGGRVQAVVYEDYWAYARTVDDYFEASMDLFRPESGFDLDRWEVHTNPEQSGIGDVPPTYVSAGAAVECCRLAPGCEVQGRLSHSILSPGVVVEEGAVVEECILMHKVRIGRNARLHKVICDKHVVVGDGAVIGHSGTAEPNRQFGQCHTCGATVIGRDAAVGNRAFIGANVQVGPAAEIAAAASVDDGVYVEGEGYDAWARRWLGGSGK